MSGNSPYEIVKLYCEKEKKNKIIERILYHKFEEELNELISNFKDINESTPPSSQVRNGYTTTLLSTTNLAKNTRLAEEELEDIFKGKIDAYKKKVGRVSFWKSVWAGIVASFIFTVLLIVIFAVAENQIKSLLKLGEVNVSSEAVKKK